MAPDEIPTATTDELVTALLERCDNAAIVLETMDEDGKPVQWEYHKGDVRLVSWLLTDMRRGMEKLARRRR